ncbi:glycosyltransferase family 8 protein [Liquorilactobacillus hordei]|uniref:glycosyltransferase family 8 protein n=1 Tax=Liquorilactobacillus hordei TaxID=468911 RepID=UPI0039E8CB14
MYSEQLNVIYASDNTFANIMGVSIVSLFESNFECKIQLYILDSKISDENRIKIEKVCKKYKQKLPIWLQAVNVEDKLNMRVVNDRGSISQYSRMLIENVVPDSVNRVLYLDCDTLITDSLTDFFNLNMDGNIIAALKDAFSKYYRINIDLNENDVMFNSGVMLIDMNKWRKYRVEDKLLNFIRVKKGVIQQGDQGVLNAILSKYTKIIDARYNTISTFYELTYKQLIKYRKPVNFYSEQQVKQACDNPAIIHFTSSFYSIRPWCRNCQHPQVRYWRYYKSISPWSGYPLQKDSREKIKRIINFLSLNSFIGVACFFQVYFRPFKNYFLKK